MPDNNGWVTVAPGAPDADGWTTVLPPGATLAPVDPDNQLPPGATLAPSPRSWKDKMAAYNAFRPTYLGQPHPDIPIPYENDPGWKGTLARGVGGVVNYPGHGLDQAAAGVSQASNPGSRMEGISNILRGAVQAASGPIAAATLPTSLPELATGARVLLGGTAGAGIGDQALRYGASKLTDDPGAQDLAGTVGSIGGGLLGAGIADSPSITNYLQNRGSRIMQSVFPAGSKLTKPLLDVVAKDLLERGGNNWTLPGLRDQSDLRVASTGQAVGDAAAAHQNIPINWPDIRARILNSANNDYLTPAGVSRGDEADHAMAVVQRLLERGDTASGYTPGTPARTVTSPVLGPDGQPLVRYIPAIPASGGQTIPFPELRSLRQAAADTVYSGNKPLSSVRDASTAGANQHFVGPAQDAINQYPAMEQANNAFHRAKNIEAVLGPDGTPGRSTGLANRIATTTAAATGELVGGPVGAAGAYAGAKGLLGAVNLTRVPRAQGWYNAGRPYGSTVAPGLLGAGIDDTLRR